MKRLLCILLMLIPLVRTGGQDIQDRQSQKARLEREIALLEGQIREASSKSTSALDRLTLVRGKVNARKALVKESTRELNAINDSINTKVREIDVLKARMDTMTVYYCKLVKSAYKNRDTRIWYMYLLSSGNIGQATRRFAYLKSLSGQMNSQAKKILETRSALEADMERLKLLRSKARTIMETHRKELAALKTEEAQDEKLVKELSGKKSRYQKELGRKKQQIVALNKEIERLIAAQVNGGKSNGGSSNKKSKPVDVKLSGEFAANMGKLPWPCEGTLAGHFGNRTHPVYKSLQLPFNNGIDLGVLKGTKVKVVFDGEVKQIIGMPGYNKCILVQHGEYFTFYCKLGSVDVKSGDKVKTGDTLGTVDTIDGQTQLHFQLWHGTKPQNPETWLRPVY